VNLTGVQIIMLTFYCNRSKYLDNQ